MVPSPKTRIVLAMDKEAILLLLNELGFDEYSFSKKDIASLIEGIIRSFAKHVDPTIKRSLYLLLKNHAISLPETDRNRIVFH